MRITLFLATAVLLATAAPAGAQATSTATPAKPGSASHLKFDLDGTAPPISGALPSAVTLSAPGFKFDRRAIPKRCTGTAAELKECPKSSRFGTGLLVVHVLGQGLDRDARIAVNVYLQSTKKVLAVANVFGRQAVPGTLDTKGGFTLRLDPLPNGQNLPGFSFSLRSMSFDFGRKQVVTKRKKVRVNGRRRTVKRKRTVQLLHNPAKCDGGSWASTMTLDFPGGAATPLASPTACTGS